MRELERQFADALVVIGVHSAKFPAERDSRHLRAAVQRLEIDHPVINDASFVVWQSYAVRAWPTLMFVDPEGRVIGKHEGEFALSEMVPVVENMIAEFDQSGLISRESTIVTTPQAVPEGVLAFPGKVVANPARDRLIIADTNHNRILVTSLAGEIRQVIGSGESGLIDGSIQEATFHHPQGLTVDGDLIYVADTGNHAIRRIDLASGQVSTIAGTGEIARGYLSGGAALETPLRSPWDVTLAGEMLAIAMAGNHQIWQLPLDGADGNEVRRMIGSGHEGLRDGPIAGAWLAQPSGIASWREATALLFTDSETSSVRVADLPGHEDGAVETFIGEDLFEFGDIDGGRDVARLQHPLGVAVHPDTGMIYVADTYNNTIKRLNPETGMIEGWLGDGNVGDANGIGMSARFFEPSGLSVTGDALYIADTNNHAIRRTSLATGEVSTIEVRNVR